MAAAHPTSGPARATRAPPQPPMGPEAPEPPQPPTAADLSRAEGRRMPFDGIGESPRRRAIAVALAMGSHARLGAESPLRALGGHCRDVVGHILGHLPIVVPDDVEALADALDIARHASGADALLILRAGEHTVGARRGEVAAHGVPGARVGHTVLRVAGWRGARDELSGTRRRVVISGEPGARLKGQLVLGGGTCGVLRGLTLQDAGDCCVRMEGDAAWDFVDCQLICGHACALRVEVQSRARLLRCSLGGEGHVGVASVYHAYGSLQERGLAKHACYGLFVSGRATLHARSCEVRFCSEAALFIAGAARAKLAGCILAQSGSLFLSGTGRGALLHVGGCKLAPAGGRVWADDDRPSQLRVSERAPGSRAGPDGGLDLSDVSAAESSDSSDDDFPAALCISCMQPGAACGCAG